MSELWPSEQPERPSGQGDDGRAASRRRWVWLVPIATIALAAVLVAVFLVGRSLSQPGSETTAAATASDAALPQTVTQTQTTTVTTSAEPPHRAGRDLGLQRPIVTPVCDGRVVVFVESIPVTAPDARERVRKWIEPWEFGPLGAADYLHSQAGCRSIRTVDDNGNPFYAVFLAPPGDVCGQFARLRSSLPPGTYPRLLSNDVGPGYDPCSR